MASFPKDSVEEDLKAPRDIINPLDLKASIDDRVAALAALSVANEPRLQAIADAFLEAPQISRKKPARIRSKARRPSLKKKYPWFDIQHVRDALRFRSSPSSLDALASTLVQLRDAGFGVVKVDLDKLLEPDRWGWRFAGADFRMPDRQIIEYYAALPEVMAANTGRCHKLYEKWRNKRVLTEETQDDIELSAAIYRDAWLTALKRQGLTEGQAIRKWKALRKKLGR